MVEPLVIVGATATGKSDLAMALARSWSGVEIVSVDSMQVYRGMDIGTAKPSPAQREEVPHHCLDLIDPSEEFSLTQFQEAVRSALEAIAARDGTPVLVGGTGLYVRAIVDQLDIPGRFPGIRDQLERQPNTSALHEQLRDLDPQAATKMEPSNRRRVIRALEVCLGSSRPFSSYGPGLDTYPSTRFRQVGLAMSRALIDERIVARYGAQMEAGFLEEVRGLLAAPLGLGATASQALGYRELLSHLEDDVDLDVALGAAMQRTRRFARRQERWFRRDPRIVWIDAENNPMAGLQSALGESTACG